jgi:hypothetical protein
MLSTIGCSRESKQTQPVSTESGSAASTAPASGEVAKEQGRALVRVVNAAPSTPKIDVLAENAPVVSDVAFKTVTPYKEVPANASEFAIKSAAQTAGDPIAKNSESIMSGRHYTLVVFPEQTEKRMGTDRNEPAAAVNETNHVATLEVISDDLVQPSEGKARVRVINAAAGTDDVEVYLRGEKDPLLSDVDFKEAVAYKEVDPIKTTIEMRIGESLASAVNPKTGEAPVMRDDSAARTGTDADRADGKSPAARTARLGAVLGTKAIDLEAGKSYTIVLTGRADSTSRHVDALVVEDTIPPAATATN